MRHATNPSTSRELSQLNASNPARRNLDTATEIIACSPAKAGPRSLGYDADSSPTRPARPQSERAGLPGGMPDRVERCHAVRPHWGLEHGTARRGLTGIGSEEGGSTSPGSPAHDSVSSLNAEVKVVEPRDPLKAVEPVQILPLLQGSAGQRPDRKDGSRASDRLSAGSRSSPRSYDIQDHN